jgi:hypothetical protein
MIYSAIVLSNENYFSTGCVKVRVFNWYLGSRWKYDSNGNIISPAEIDNLASDPTMINEGDMQSGPTQDFLCWVYSPMGGGINYGMFHLPQVNERGLVSFIDGDLHKPIWMGSYFRPLLDNTQYPKQVIDQINAPNDDITGKKDGASYQASASAVPAGDPNAIILRTKHTTLTPSGNSYAANDLDWEQQTTENLVLLGSDQVRVRHYSNFNDGIYQEIVMKQGADSAPIITTSVVDNKNNYNTVVNQSSNSFSVTITGQKGSFVWTVTGGDTGIYLQDQFGNTIFGNANGLEIEGTGDNLSRFSYLKNVIDKIMQHTHIVYGPSGPTSQPMDSSGAPALSQVTQQDEGNIRTPKIITSSS